MAATHTHKGTDRVDGAKLRLVLLATWNSTTAEAIARALRTKPGARTRLGLAIEPRSSRRRAEVA